MPTSLRNHRNFIARYGRQICLLCAVLFVAAGSAFAQPAGNGTPDPIGEWLTAKGLARIRIVNCDSRLWGVVTWEQYAGGIDDKNPDPKKRGRPTLGMPVLLGMTQTSQNQWSGRVYSSQDGRTYSANISLLNPNVLKVQGCVLGFLCGGENWTRVTQPPPQSGTTARQSGSTGRTGTPTTRSNAGTHAARSNGARARSATQSPANETDNAQRSDADVCLGIASASGLPHERRLK